MTKKIILLAALCCLVFSPADAAKKKAGVVESHPALAPYFSDPAPGPVAPRSDGFIRRWTLLEPILKPNRSNTVFVDSYVRENFYTEMFPNQFTCLPKEGDKVKVDGNTLYWHALDSKLANVKLYRYATGLEKERYGLIFWAVTEIDCPEDLNNVRLFAGSNSASIWWVDGKEVLLLSNDRRMVADDGAPARLNLAKGKHTIRVAVINGPGMSDFCVRFKDEAGKPVTNFTILNR